ncbi:MAG: PilZ domain-containing protein [Candidatus Methylomirabilales bacterium]
MRKEGDDRRKLPRFRIISVGGSITTPVEADVLNLSMGGALVEHQGTLRVGSECTLNVPLAGAPVNIRCHVAHSTVDHRATGPAGEGLLFYRTGLEFLELSREAKEILATLIRSYGEGGEGG